MGFFVVVIDLSFFFFRNLAMHVQFVITFVQPITHFGILNVQHCIVKIENLKEIEIHSKYRYVSLYRAEIYTIACQLCLWYRQSENIHGIYFPCLDPLTYMWVLAKHSIELWDCMLIFLWTSIVLIPLQCTRINRGL